MSTQRFMTSQSVKNIMQKRILIPVQAEGKRVRLTIQGNGNVIDVKDGEGNLVQSIVEPSTVLQKKIFNCKANSQIAMQSERNRQILKDALAAEKAGDAEKAHGLFSDYLNKVQLSFGVLLPNANADRLANGEEIAAVITKVTTENGSLLTVDPSTISIVAPESYGTTTFNLDDFEDAPAEETVSAGTVSETLEA